MSPIKFHNKTENKPRLTVDDVNVVPPKKLKPAIGGTVVGNFMEWYDFGIYGYLTVTMTAVFAQGLPTEWQLLAVMFGFAVSYLVRPLGGGIVLGPLGDKIGRQKVLYVTMAMMAIATALIGLLPTAASIGGWALILLYVLKLFQGFSTGGEYAGATTYVSEFSPDRRRGYYSSFLDLGSYTGFAAGATVVAVTTWVTTHFWGPTAMEDFGWRIPFLTAIPLGIIAVYVRTRIPETPAFENQGEDTNVQPDNPEDPYSRLSLTGVVRHHWRPLLIAIAIAAAANTAGYALTSYMPVYLETHIGMHSASAAMVTVPVLIVMALCLPAVGKISDRVGRKPVYWFAVVFTLVMMVPAFMIMNTGTLWGVVIALCIVAVSTGTYVFLSASAIPAMFPTASRFSGMGISYNLAVSLFGGTTPLITQFLLQRTGLDIVPALYIMAFSAVAAIALLFMPETARRPLPGSFPTVETKQEAKEIVANQDEDPLIVIEQMPFPENRVPEPARV